MSLRLFSSPLLHPIRVLVIFLMAAPSFYPLTSFAQEIPFTNTLTLIPTSTIPPSNTPTAVPTNTSIPTNTPSPVPTNTLTNTPSLVATNTPSPQLTDTPTSLIPTNTFTPIPTSTETPTNPIPYSPTIEISPSNTPIATLTSTATYPPTNTYTAQVITNTFTSTFSFTATDTHTPLSWLINRNNKPIGFELDSLEETETLFVTTTLTFTPTMTGSTSSTPTMTGSESDTPTMTGSDTDTQTPSGSETPTFTETCTATPTAGTWTVTPTTITGCWNPVADYGIFAFSGDGCDKIQGTGQSASIVPNNAVSAWGSPCGYSSWISDNVNGYSPCSPPTTITFERPITMSGDLLSKANVKILFKVDDEVTFILSNESVTTTYKWECPGSGNNQGEGFQYSHVIRIPAENFASGANTLTTKLINIDSRETEPGSGICGSTGISYMMWAYDKTLPEDVGCKDKRFCPIDEGGGRVDFKTGNMHHSINDLNIPYRGVTLKVSRTFNSNENRDGIFGHGWTSNLDEKLIQIDSAHFWLCRSDGANKIFTYTSNGIYRSPGSDCELTLVDYEGWRLRYPGGYERWYKLGTIELAYERDKNDNAITYIYNQYGQITTMRDDANRSVSIFYNYNGNAVSITDPLGQVSTSYSYQGVNLVGVGYYPNSGDAKHASYSYNDWGQMTQCNDEFYEKGLKHINYFYDIAGRVDAETDSSGTTIVHMHYESEGSGKKTIVAEPSGSCGNCLSAAGTYHYNSSGAFKSLDRPEGVTESFNDDSNKNRTDYTNGRGYTTYRTFDAYGNMLTITDPLSQSVTYSYDGPHHQISSIDDPENAPITFQYDGNGNLTQRDSSSLDDDDGWYYSYYTNGDLHEMTDPNNKTWHYTYDNYGYLQSATDPDNNTTEYQFDAIDRLIHSWDAKNHAMITYTRDYFGNLKEANGPLGYHIAYVYDAHGNTTQEQDSRFAWTRFYYDDRDRLTRVTDANFKSVIYTYNDAGNLTTLTDARSNSTDFTYDGLNRLTSVTYPINGSVTYNYNKNGAVTYRRDGNFIVTNYEYDNADRLEKVFYPGGKSVTNTYDAANNLISRAESFGTYHYDYDNLNRMIYKSDGFGYPVSFVRDYSGNVKKVVYPSNNSVTYQFTGVNKTAYATDSYSRQIGFSYDDNQNLYRIDKEGHSTTYISDIRNRPTTIVNDYGGSVPNYYYDYDQNGNPVTIRRDSKTSVFTYDQINQITNANLVYGSGGSPQTLTQSFEYDAAGNRIHSTENGYKITDYSYNGSNQLTSRYGPEIIADIPHPNDALAQAYNYRKLLLADASELKPSVVLMPTPTPLPPGYQVPPNPILRFIGNLIPAPDEANAAPATSKKKTPSATPTYTPTPKNT